MRYAPALLCALLLGACSLPQRLASERAAVYAEEARFDSLNAVPPDRLTAVERAERDSLAGASFERQERLAAVERRKERHRREAVLAVLFTVLAVGAVGGYLALVSGDG